VSHKDGRVVLSAWVDPVLRDHAREAARLSGLEFSHWVARAVRQTMARESADRAVAAAIERGECGTCGYTPCACDQQ
jgi:predicted kinase